MYTSDQLAEAVRDVDVVVMCLPGTAATRGMLSRECIAQMDPQTIVVNCGRGFTVDEEALIDALREKRIAGAVLDVTAVEPLSPDSPLWDMEHVILTPHISGHDDDPVNYQFIFRIFRENLTRYLAGQPRNIRWTVRGDINAGGYTLKMQDVATHLHFFEILIFSHKFFQCIFHLLYRRIMLISMLTKGWFLPFVLPH